MKKCPSHLEKASSSLTDSLRKSGAMVTDPPKANSVLSQNKSPLDEAAAKWVVLLLQHTAQEPFRCCTELLSYGLT